MSLRRLLAINLAVLAWIGLMIAFPVAGQWIGRAVGGPGYGLVGGAAAFVLFLVGTIAGAFFGLTWSERQSVERVRREGVACTAWVKSYRRISMTQHRVLWVIQFPQGAVGREYVQVGLSDPWLADVCALGRPVPVIAHPEGDTVIINA